MYGVAAAPSLSIHWCMDRLSREQWLDAALVALARDGHAGLRSELLAKRLKVSRGSFYWHFEDVPAFHAAVLLRWESAAIDQPLEASARRAGTGGATAHLAALADIAFIAPPGLERAVHAWAAVSPAAAEAVSRVNKRRVRLLTGMFEKAGATRTHAESSAVVMYWAYLGRIFCPEFPASNSRLREVKRRLSRPA
jgi:AcrR family transcriptional regulator